MRVMSPLWSLVHSSWNWFAGIDRANLVSDADDIGWDVKPAGLRYRLVERGTGIETEPLTLRQAEAFLDFADNQRTRRKNT